LSQTIYRKYPIKTSLSKTTKSKNSHLINHLGGRKENIMIRLAIIALLISVLIRMTGCKPSPYPYQEINEMIDSIDSDTRKLIDSAIDESSKIDRPEYSKEDVLYTKYSGLLEQIDNNIERSDSVSNLASNLKKVTLPNNLIYLALKKEDPEGSFSDYKIIEIVKTFESGDITHITFDNSGYGTVGNKKIVIIQYPLDKFKELEHCIIYLEHKD